MFFYCTAGQTGSHFSGNIFTSYSPWPAKLIRIMLNWLKPKKKAKSEEKSVTASPASQTPAKGRDDLVADALKAAEVARQAIGQEKLNQLAALIAQKQKEQETSPAAQAKKIIAQMDKDRLGDFMKLMINDSQTKH